MFLRWLSLSVNLCFKPRFYVSKFSSETLGIEGHICSSCALIDIGISFVELQGYDCGL